MTELPKNLTNLKAMNNYFKTEIQSLKNKHPEGERTGRRFEDFAPSLLRLIYEYGIEINHGKKTELYRKSNLDKNPDSKISKDDTFAIIFELFIKKNLEESNRTTGKLSKHTRALSYAYEHRIQPNWLGAFLKEVGGYEVAALKYDNQEKESWVKKEALFK